MIEEDRGHTFYLEHLDGGQRNLSRLRFVKRMGPRYPGNTSAYEGTTSQEVLRALIARARYVYRQRPCWETRLSVWLYRTAIWLYEHRAARVHKRKLSLRTLPSIETLRTCGTCGHVQCLEHEWRYVPKEVK